MAISEPPRLRGIKLTGFEPGLFLSSGAQQRGEQVATDKANGGQGPPSSRRPQAAQVDKNRAHLWDCLCQVMILITRLTRYQGRRSQRPIQERLIWTTNDRVTSCVASGNYHLPQQEMSRRVNCTLSTPCIYSTACVSHFLYHWSSKKGEWERGCA